MMTTHLCNASQVSCHTERTHQTTRLKSQTATAQQTQDAQDKHRNPPDPKQNTPRKPNRSKWKQFIQRTQFLSQNQRTQFPRQNQDRREMTVPSGQEHLLDPEQQNNEENQSKLRRFASRKQSPCSQNNGQHQTQRTTTTPQQHHSGVQHNLRLNKQKQTMPALRLSPVSHTTAHQPSLVTKTENAPPLGPLMITPLLATRKCQDRNIDAKTTDLLTITAAGTTDKHNVHNASSYASFHQRSHMVAALHNKIIIETWAPSTNDPSCSTCRNHQLFNHSANTRLSQMSQRCRLQEHQNLMSVATTASNDSRLPLCKMTTKMTTTLNTQHLSPNNALQTLVSTNQLLNLDHTDHTLENLGTGQTHPSTRKSPTRSTGVCTNVRQDVSHTHGCTNCT